MNLDKTISIKCDGNIYLSMHDLNWFQGNLKELSSDNLNKLKQSLIKEGLPLALHIWVDKQNKNWIIDGHTRIAALKALENEGYFIPPLPCVVVKAISKKEAAKIVMVSNARYAKLSQESISDFMINMDLQLPEMEFLEIPELKNAIPDFEDQDFNPGQDDDEKKIKTCPHCGEVI